MKTGIRYGRRILIIAAMLFLASVCCIGGIKLRAYFSGADVLRNRFTIKENQIAIEEPDFMPQPSLAPGGEYPKTVQVRNTDGVDCYIRVCLVYSDDAAKPLLETDINTTDWIYDTDGDFYYYREALREGDVTKPLLTKIKVADSVTGEQLDALGAFSLEVVAESCQKGDADTYQEAWRRMTANQNKVTCIEQSASPQTIALHWQQSETQNRNLKTVVRRRKLPVCMESGGTRQTGRLDRDEQSQDYSVTNRSKMSIVAISLELDQAEEKENISDSGQQKTVLPGQQLPMIPRITNEGANCYVRLRMADVSGEQADVSGEQADVSGEQADVSGEQADVSGEQADASGEQAGVSGEQADVSGEQADVSGEQADVSGEQADASGEQADASGEQADVSGAQTKESDDVQLDHTGTGVFTLADVYGLKEGWIQIGEYLYLTKTLAHGECVQVFAGMTVPQTLDPVYMGTSLAFGFIAEAVQADYFAPDFNSDSPWGALQTENCMYSEYVFSASGSGEESMICLTYEGGAQQFVSATDDFFARFGAMLPGGVYSGMVRVENAASADTTLFFHADNADGAESLLDELEFSLVQIADDGNEKVLYDGNYRAKTLQNELSFGTFRKGDGCTLRFTIRVPADLSNAAALAQAQIDWHFRAQQQKETVPEEGETPAGSITRGGRTGDRAAVGLWSAAALLAGSVLAGLYAHKRMKKRKGERSANQTSTCRKLLKTSMSAVRIVLLLLLLLYGCIMAVPHVFGLSTGIVLSGSMEPAIPTGSLCYIREAKPAILSRGEIVVFRAGSRENGMQVVHRVISNDIAGQQLRTKGDNNEAEDIAPVSYAAVVGRVVHFVPFLGYVCIWVQRHVILLATCILPAFCFGSHNCICKQNVTVQESLKHLLFEA